MVITDRDFSDTEARVFLIPFEASKHILAQVGFGGDLGIFDGTYAKDAAVQSLEPPLLFRVHFGRVSPRQFEWIDCGMHPYKDALQEPYTYVHQPVGADEYVLVKYGSDETNVNCDEAAAFEPLATWSHEHIVDRFQSESRLS